MNARRALQALGANIKTARLKRRISVQGFAERVGVSESTISRLEKGDDGVSIGTLAMACLVLGEIGRISDFLDPGSDDTGLLLDREALPKRIDRKRGSRPTGSAKDETALPNGDDDEGVGF
ncbi:MAG: helix-turn-helix domain-containing protein [Desulfomicrobium sp.]|uniref:helix-turn-helix domain-containing protein n=1 Tax=Hoeflea sp. TaxID=1940281 RepID=UPI0025BD5643|nr:helix-turn-helix transcriptional regulator [Hoeflea sp.]MBU4527396.1 helix-turn-helix domain-containing protein [Alphaproteobacteria bacterium]MBV1711974.1 helix-turn-helix domain-containing protein [Desulfomicrobium sp.]MBU4546281.1 helix-turn-helix domain-containing protein [Alphaproteobacteria bacterium]MBU4552103.1 helix-turn-helix domain-containing protein [Alphaproteobacteria bacterium]MBV1782415.1 helix-turn-helix domain-containing protein [Hoeflea sp.]